MWKYVVSSLLSLWITSGFAPAAEVAGRVMQVDRDAKTFMVHPYADRRKNQPVQGPDVRITVTGATMFRWNPNYPGLPRADMNAVKRGTWVRVVHQNNRASTVTVHAEQRPTRK